MSGDKVIHIKSPGAQNFAPLWALCMLLCIATLISSNARAQVMFTIAGNGSAGYYGDAGPATAAALDSPGCVVADGLGNIYISDQLNNCIRKVTASGIITTIAGTGAPGYNGDSIAATAAQLNSNWGIAVDRFGNVYVADQNNNRIRKVNPAGMITTIAGTGTAGFYGDHTSALNAQLSHPLGLAVDRTGNIFVGDADNYRIRRIDTAGIITTVAGAGSGGYSGDGGPATAAHIEFMWGLATDAAGYVYICDGNNNRVRRADPSPGGQITTVAGNGDPGSAGDGGSATAAQLTLPTGVFVNSSGEIFIADCKNNRIRKVSASGIISTVAGTGDAGFAGDNELATSAMLHHPLTVWGDENNNLFIADLDNVRIREVKIVPLLSFTAGHTQTLTVCENGSDFSLDTPMAVLDYVPGLTDVWNVLTIPSHGFLDFTYSSISTGSTLLPSGLSYTPEAGYAGNDVFKVRVTNGVLSDTTIINIFVTPLVTTAGIITGQSQLCTSYAIALADSIDGGMWACNNMNVRMTIEGDTIAVTGEIAGTTDIWYIVSNACNADTAVKTLSVVAAPDPGSITGSNAVCVGSSIVLTDSAPGGAWESANGTATVSAGVVTGQHPGPALIVYTVQNSACAVTATYIVNVDSLPDPPVISGVGAICTGTELALDGGAGLGTWTSGNQEIATVDGQTGQVIGVAPGTAAISYVITNVCGSSGSTKVMTVNPLPDSPVITRRGDMLFAPAGYAAYQWTVDGIAIAWAVSDTCKASVSGFYGITVANSLGCNNVSAPYTWPGCTADDLEIYPNPTQAAIYIDWCDKTSARVMGADGRIILAAEDTNSLDLSSLADGVYMISVYDRNGKMVKTKRITKTAK